MIRDYIQITITKTPIARYSTVAAFRNRWKTKWIESIHGKQRYRACRVAQDVGAITMSDWVFKPFWMTLSTEDMLIYREHVKQTATDSQDAARWYAHRARMERDNLALIDAELDKRSAS